MTDQRQDLAYLLDDIHDGCVTEGGCDFEGYNRDHGPTDAVDKVLASDWLAEHDREVTARTIDWLEAHDGVSSDTQRLYLMARASLLPEPASSAPDRSPE